MSLFSDFNSNTKASLLETKRKRYSDFDMNMPIHPLSGDIVPLKDLEAIRNSVKNLVLTNFFEPPFAPRKGGNLRALLFENADPFTVISIRENIETVLRTYEPRIDTIRVDVNDNSDNNSYDVTVNFRIKEVNELVDIDIRLQRYR